MLVAPYEQVYPFRQLVGVGAVLVVGAWLFAFVPVLVQQHDVEGVARGLFEADVLCFEEFSHPEGVDIPNSIQSHLRLTLTEEHRLDMHLIKIEILANIIDETTLMQEITHRPPIHRLRKIMIPVHCEYRQPHIQIPIHIVGLEPLHLHLNGVIAFGLVKHDALDFLEAVVEGGEGGVDLVEEVAAEEKEVGADAPGVFEHLAEGIEGVGAEDWVLLFVAEVDVGRDEDLQGVGGGHCDFNIRS